MKVRQLKVEPMGEQFGQAANKSLIRLKGRWLKQAGFEPGSQIEVIIEQPGRLILRQPVHPTLDIRP